MSGRRVIGNAAAALFLTAVVSTVAAADALPPQIQAEMVTEANEPGVIKTMILDDDAVSKATLYYRKPGEIRYTSIEMKKRGDVWYRDLKRDFGVEGTVEYYILAEDKSGNQSTLPAINPSEQPLRAALDAVVNQSAEEVVLTTPEPGATVVSGDQFIIVTFYKTGREVDISTVRIMIDDRDRTREAEIRGNMLVWEPRRPLEEGRHLVEIKASDTNGDPIGPNVWSFDMKTSFQLPLGTSGTFYMGLQHDDRSNAGDGEIPLWDNKIDIGLSGERGGFSWEGGVMLSSEESSFLTTENLDPVQPVNRYYATLRSRHLKVHFGDNNPAFSDLSLKGILVRGISASFLSNRLNVEFIKGYNQRDLGEEVEVVQGIWGVTAAGYYTTEGDSTSFVDISTQPYQRIAQDTTGEYHVYEFSPGTFRRDVTALKVDTAPVRNRFFTWNVGMNLFSAQDDSTTLHYSYDDSTEARVFQYGDSTSFTTGYTPSKNWVGTIETSLRFNRDRSVLSAEFGGTIVTENLFGVVTDDIRDELPEGIDDETFRFNGSTQTSFDKMRLDNLDSLSTGEVAGRIAEALTSVYLIRLVTPLPIPKITSRFKGELFRIPTHYVSLGNPNQRTDIGGFRADIKNQFFRNQISFDFGYEAYSDNLDNETTQYANADSTLTKNLTKDTETVNVSTSYRPRFLPEYSPSLTVGYRRYTAVNDADLAVNDANAAKQIDMDTNTLMVTFGATLPVGLQTHAASLSFSQMTIGDNRPVADYDRSESESQTVLLTVNSAVNPLPLTLSTTLGMTGNTSYYKIEDTTTYRKSLTTDIIMANVSGTYTWLRSRRLATTAGIGYIGASNGDSGDYAVDNTKVTLRFETEYRLNETTSFGGEFRFITYSDAVNGVNDYTEPIIGVNVKSNF